MMTFYTFFRPIHTVENDVATPLPQAPPPVETPAAEDKHFRMMVTTRLGYIYYIFQDNNNQHQQKWCISRHSKHSLGNPDPMYKEEKICETEERKFKVNVLVQTRTGMIVVARLCESSSSLFPGLLPDKMEEARVLSRSTANCQARTKRN